MCDIMLQLNMKCNLIVVQIETEVTELYRKASDEPLKGKRKRERERKKEIPVVEAP